MKKRGLSILLSVLMVFSIIPITTMRTQAISIDNFNSLVSTFKSTVYPDKSTYKDNPSKTGGYQCFGFANELALYIFGSYPTNSMSATTVNSGWSRVYGGSAVDNLSVGDIVRYNFHSIFITAISGDTVYYAQANVPSGTNRVTYDNPISRSELKSKVNNTLTHSGATTKGWVAHYNGGIPNTCSCSTSYAGSYTTKNVSSTLTIRSGHGTSYSYIGSIPANATFTVTKADGSWAHIVYNGTSGYVSYAYIQRIIPNENIIDTRYPTPFKAYCISNDKIPAYDCVGGSTVGNIYGNTDFCEVLEVYTNGWAKVNCPWSGYSNGRIVYVQLSVFIDSATAVTPRKDTVVNKTTAYYIAGGTSSPGSVYVNDVCTIVAQKGNQYCVICPWSTSTYSGRYMVWCDSSAFVHTHSYGNWGNYDSTYHSRTCECGQEEKVAHTWNQGKITVYSSCEGKGIKECTCTVCGATKTETLAASGHSYNQGVITTPATCTSNGVKTYTCNTCGKTKTETIAKTSHGYAAGIYTDPNHPHKIYNTCVCGAKADSGRTGKVSSCTQCYPAPVISGIVSSKNDIYVGDTVTFTMNATGATEYSIAIGDGINVLLEKKQSTNSVNFTFTKEGVHYVWGYAYNGEIYSSSEVLTITVKQPKTLSSVSIESNPTKTVYSVGESLNTSGLQLKLSYSDGTSKIITSGFTTSGFSSATAGTKTVTVSYEGKTATFDVVVKPAVDENAPSIILESKKITKNQEFTVTVSVKNNPGFSYLEVTPNYSEELTLIKAENGNLISDFTQGKQYVWVSDANVTSDGVLMTFTFSVDSSVEKGNYQVGFNVRTCANYDEESVEFSITNANIEVIDFVYGDATGDGSVDGFDVIRLKKYLANYDYDTEISTVDASFGADANGDGKIDGFDVIRLKKYLANYDYDTGESTVILGPQ